MENIEITNARQNNLRNISIKIPKYKIVVFTGVSGSGKSSLVFETIGAEAQRQINETQNSFIRNRLQHYGLPDVDKIEISIEYNEVKVVVELKETEEEDDCGSVETVNKIIESIHFLEHFSIFVPFSS